jgi:hypothetical protein
LCQGDFKYSQLELQCLETPLSGIIGIQYIEASNTVKQPTMLRIGSQQIINWPKIPTIWKFRTPVSERELIKEG